MDPVTLAIVGGLAAGVAEGMMTSVAQEAYNGLKALIKKRLGTDSNIAKTIDDLEANPNSQGRRLTLAEEVANTKADQDPGILEAAQYLVAQLALEIGGVEHVKQIAIGNHIAQANRGSTASINANKPREN